MEQANLIENIKKGVESAFEYLYDTFFEALCLYTFRMVGDYAEAEEIVQDTIFTVWNKRDNLDEVKDIKSYLYKSVHNKSLNLIKHRKVKNSYKSEALYKLDCIDRDSSESLLYKELTDKIEKAIEGLPERTREAFKMSRFENYSYQQIADEFGITTKAVEALISRALKHLRQNLQEYMALLIFLSSIAGGR